MPKVKFLPDGKEIDVPAQTCLFEVARRVGLNLESTCGGKKKCGKCRVVIKNQESTLPPPAPEEIGVLGERLVQKGYRLACAVTVTQDLTVLVPPESRAGKQKILSSASSCAAFVTPSPNIQPYNVKVPSPSLREPKSDMTRLFAALDKTYGLKGLYADPYIIRKLPRVIPARDSSVTAIVRNRAEVIEISPKSLDALYGMAFDVGTTTVVGYIWDLSRGKEVCVKTAMNPQIPFGDDIITRISFCNEKQDGLEKLHTSIIGCINNLINEATLEAHIDPEQIMEMTIVGNTAMHHLLAKLDPRHLAMAPFVPVVSDALDIKARDMGIHICESAYIHLLPLKAGFVGSDTIACILSSGLYKSKDPILLIDIGTNGEIVFGSREKMLCCSTAAGPAFEGGHIKWGMRAAAGAIEKVRIDPRSLEVHLETVLDKPPIGICGSGLISAIADLLRGGIVSHTGNFNKASPPRVRQGDHGMEFVLSFKQENPTGNDIVITQQDISELQMAKSAIYAGANVLMNQLGAQPSKILLAGAGGNYIDPKDAMTIGLLPFIDMKRVSGIGNAAGYGACLALINKAMRTKAKKIAQDLSYLELSGLKEFNELFTANMFFPTDSPEYLGKC